MHRIKAIGILAMIFVNWAALIALFISIHIVAAIFQYMSGIRWSYSMFLAEDHLVNVVMGGHFLTTISAEIGNMHLSGSRTGAEVAGVVNWLFWIGTRDPRQKNHCINAIQKDDIFVFSPRRAIAGTLLFQATNFFIIYGIINTYIT